MLALILTPATLPIAIGSSRFARWFTFAGMMSRPRATFVAHQLDGKTFPLRDALHLGGDGTLAGEVHLSKAGHAELPSPVRTGSGSKGVISAAGRFRDGRAPLSPVNLT